VSEAYSSLDATYAAARWGWYTAAFLVLGAGSYAPFLFRIRTGLHATEADFTIELTRRAARTGLAAAVALLVLTLIRLYLQSRTLLDPEDRLTTDLFGAVLASDWGHGWVRQAVIAGLATLAFGAAVSGSRFGWMVAVASGGGLGVVAGMTGHAATEKSGPYGLLLDAAHVWAGGLWLGGLAVLLIAGLPACRALPEVRRMTAVRALVADFSRRALLFAPLTVGLGVWLAARYLGWGFPLRLFSSQYGWGLFLKIATVVVVGAVGAYNWRVVQPGLATPAGERRFLRTGTLELIFGALLLLATAALVALAIPEAEA
jgi:putative copper export protein